MRIGMVLDQKFPPDDRVEKEALSLIEGGHSVYLLCLGDKKNNLSPNYKGIILEKIYIPLIIIKKLRALTNTFFNFYPYLWAYLTIKFIKKYDLDVLHIHDLYMFKSGIIAKHRTDGKIPIVGDLHENYVDALKEYRFSTTFPGNILINIDKWRISEHEWINEMNYIITVVDEMKNRVAPFLNDKSKAIVIENTVDIDSFLDYKRDLSIQEKYKNKFIVSYIGGFDYHRGLNILVEAIAQLHDLEDLLLVIVGRMERAHNIRELIARLGIEEKVIFESFKPMGIIQNYFQTANIGVIPHIKSVQTDNSSPNKLYQYMLMAKPVIVSNCTSLQNIVESKEIGLVFQSGDSADLAGKIRLLYQDKNLAGKYGETGKKTVYSEYNWSKNTKRLNDLYQEIEQKS